MRKIDQTTRMGFMTLLVTSVFLAACGQSEAPVRVHVEGEFNVRTDSNEIEKVEGFRITVLTQVDGDVDTLGTALSGPDGRFAFDVNAQEEGVYPLVVERAGANLAISEFVAADGDSVKVTGTFPLGARSLRIVSAENAAWTAYRNAKAQHNRSISELANSDQYTRPNLVRVVLQTSVILWSIDRTFPGTIGGDLSKAESVIMMGDWDDQAVLEKYAEVDLSNASIVDVARVARRSVARTFGQQAALDMLNAYLESVPEERKPGIMAEQIVAHADSGQVTKAVEIAMSLRRTYPESPWADWATRATYDLENLQPGMEAPAFDVQSRTGENLTSSNLLGKFIILEFFDPMEASWMREYESRDRIAGLLNPNLFQTISVSVQPDMDLNVVLFEEGTHPGHFVFSEEGGDQQIVKDYNVNVIPTRFLLDPNGEIVSKYTGQALTTLERDLIDIIQSINDYADQISR